MYDIIIISQRYNKSASTTTSATTDKEMSDDEEEAQDAVVCRLLAMIEIPSPFAGINSDQTATTLYSL